MKTDYARIKRTIMNQLMNNVDYHNDGRVIGPRRCTPVMDLHYLREHSVSITRIPNESREAVMIDGKPYWNIVRRYASRKVNGSYKQLKPSLVPYAVDPKRDEWARINAALESVDVEKAMAGAYRWDQGE